MNEQQAINWIHKQIKFGIKPGLKRVEWLLEQFGHPEEKLKTIHVAGTNGKGSTVSYLRNILEAHEFRVGTFTSPYIEIFNERISINGIPIKGKDLVHYVNQIKPLCEKLSKTQLGSPTEFEIITVIAFKYFYDHKVDYAIFEVGLGGRLDSTNVIKHPILSIITTIGYDHIDILGDTLEEIAFEKSGIIKVNRPVITNVKQHNALNVIKQQAQEKQTNVYKLGDDYSYEWERSMVNGEQFSYLSKYLNIYNIKTSMSGEHQIQNACLSIFSFIKIAKLEGFKFYTNKIKSAITSTFWIGRFEIIQDNPKVILDGAHNEAAVETLIKTLNNRFPDDRIHILISVVKGKPIKEIIEMLTEKYDDITITPFDYFNSYRYDELKNISKKFDIKLVKNWEKAFNNYIRTINKDDILVITGSLYFVSEVRQNLLPVNRRL